MSLLTDRGCPECGAVSLERALHQATPERCPACSLADGLVKAARSRLSRRERFCPVCRVTIARGSWSLHEHSKYHKLLVRIQFLGAVRRAERAHGATAS